MYHISIINTDLTVTKTKQEHIPMLTQLRDAVGGHIETVPYWTEYRRRMCVVFCNEEGKLEGLPVNERATAMWYHYVPRMRGRDVLVGNICIVACDTYEELAQL